MVTLKFVVMNALRNSVRLVGHLGSDPDFKTFGDGKDLARASLATNERYKSQSGEWEEDSQWHNLVFWGKLAQVAQDLLRKGTLVLIEGKLINRSFMNDKEELQYITEIRVGQLLVLSKRPDSNGLEEEPISP